MCISFIYIYNLTLSEISSPTFSNNLFINNKNKLIDKKNKKRSFKMKNKITFALWKKNMIEKMSKKKDWWTWWTPHLLAGDIHGVIKHTASPFYLPPSRKATLLLHYLLNYSIFFSSQKWRENNLKTTSSKIQLYLSTVKIAI